MVGVKLHRVFITCWNACCVSMLAASAVCCNLLLTAWKHLQP